ncbi:30S ribosomal protein S20 [Peptococcus simiae]|uniref:30S ribosomal protein S20 n=1 Tax=Peptococcus simiae TaxID=1643805 RepID=UPI003981818D
MANLKSAKKRAKVADVRRVRNNSKLTAMRTAIKNFDKAVEAQDKEAAKEAMAVAIKRIDQIGSKGLLHKNNVANKKSRIAKAFNNMA